MYSVMETRFLVFEQIGEHGGGFLWTVSFTEFGQPSERCPVGGVLFDPRGGLIPSARERSGVSAVNVDFVTHAADSTTRRDTEQWSVSAGRVFWAWTNALFDAMVGREKWPA